MEIPHFNFITNPVYQGYLTVSDLADTYLTSLKNRCLGIYKTVFGHVQKTEGTPIITSNPGFVGVEALKQKQKEHLAELLALAQAGEWRAIQMHTSHPASGFDWWMFPIDRPSSGYGDQYQVSRKDIEALKQDQEFLKNYREGVILVAKSWGWDLESGRDVADGTRYWTDYQVRLGKMIHSLRLFDQKDLYDSLVVFIDTKRIRPSLEEWIQKML